MTKRPRFTLRRRLAQAFAIVGTVVVVVAAVATGALVRTNQHTDHLIMDINPARVQSAELESAYLNQETGVRGYVNSRNEDFLEPYRDGQKAAATSIALLRTLLADEPTVQDDIDAVVAAGERWRVEYAEPTIAAVRAGQPTGLAETGKNLFDAVRGLVTTLQDRITELRAVSLAALHEANRLLYITVGLAVFGVVLAAALLWIAQRRWILGPLAQVGAEARLVAGGDISRRVPITGPAEIAELADDVESMRRNLVASLTTTINAREQLIAQADQLEIQAADLRRSNAELEQFAYVASHDLQEPLRKVASFCQLLDRRYAGQLDERGEQYIAFAVDGAKRMQRLINDLLGFSRVGRTTGDFTDVDMDEVLERALISLTTAREEADAEVEADPLPTVSGGLTLLTQVFQNLIGNAIKFRGTEPPRIRITVERSGTDWLFRCGDNGIGVDVQYAERVFVLFQRLHGKEEYEGTGIGLAMCRKIIEHHGGRIWLDPDHTGPGTTICWTLPMLPGDAANVDDLRAGDAPDAADEGTVTEPSTVSALTGVQTPATVPSMEGTS